MSAFVALVVGLVYLDLLGVLLCVLAEMRHRGKSDRIHGTDREHGGPA
jgi:hypothetical protein